MKIAYLANAGSVHFTRWYEYFIKKGHDVHLITGNTCDLKFRVDLPGLTVHELPEFRVRNRILSFVVNLIVLPLIIKKLRRFLAEINPDIVHAHQVYPYGFWGALAGLRPLAVTPTGSDVIIMPTKYYAYRKLTEYVLGRADLVTGDSIVLKDSCEKYGLKTAYKLVQNGVDLKNYPFGMRKKIVRKRFGLEDSSPVIFYSRAFLPLYNVDVIIRSIPFIVRKYPKARFMFAHHAGFMKGQLQAIVDELNVGDHVVFTGLIDHSEMPQYYATADLSVSIPSSDSSPHSVYESMACGVPTIISSLPWTRHAMRHGENTYMVQEIEPQELANAVEAVLENQVMREKIIKGGRETVEKYFSYEDNMARMEGLMLGLINDGGRH